MQHNGGRVNGGSGPFESLTLNCQNELENLLLFRANQPI